MRNLGGLNAAPIHLDGIHREVGPVSEGGLLPIDGDAAFADQFLHSPPRAHTRPGQDFLQAFLLSHRPPPQR